MQITNYKIYNRLIKSVRKFQPVIGGIKELIISLSPTITSPH